MSSKEKATESVASDVLQRLMKKVGLLRKNTDVYVRWGVLGRRSLADSTENLGGTNKGKRSGFADGPAKPLCAHASYQKANKQA